MGNTKFLSILFFFYVLTTSGVVSIRPSRSRTGKDSFNQGTYEANCFDALQHLPSNFSDENGFHDTSVGQGLNTVYALGMCIPGTQQDTCFNCILSGSRHLTRNCFNQTEAFLYFHLRNTYCLLRYSNHPFGSLGMSPVETAVETRRVLQSNSTEFDAAWEALMNSTMDKAISFVHYRLLRAEYFAMDVLPFKSVLSVKRMYTFMLCSMDISPLKCSECLRQSVRDFSTCCRGKPGRIQRPSCFMRWDMFPFGGLDFDGASTPQKLIATKKDGGLSKGSIAAIVVITFVIMALIALRVSVSKRRKSYQAFSATDAADDDTYSESLQFKFRAIEVATSDFQDSNKLGKGGFGEVYKGKFPNGIEFAVKRLSKNSGQGEQEFKNEVLLVAKLQHKNLVRLLGFSLQGEEKLLIYEFVPNKSLDCFLFDPKKRTQLDWTLRCNIIGGITRGLLYLHQDSRLKIIHRDLKASNILLDANMNPKIADFGGARIVGMDQTVAKTLRVVGTFGYMPPEYVTHGQFSTKSDVYSFGVLILEIISGKRNSSFYQMDALVNNLVTYVWRLWEHKLLHEVIDPQIRGDCKSDEVIRYIHIGLLCVQENPSMRPTMSTIHQMFTTSSMVLPVPSPPGFFFSNGSGSDPLSKGLEPGQSSSMSFICSVDEATITDVTPR